MKTKLYEIINGYNMHVEEAIQDSDCYVVISIGGSLREFDLARPISCPLSEQLNAELAKLGCAPLFNTAKARIDKWQWSRVTVTLKDDEEGIFGPEGTEGLDVDATITAYHKQVCAAIQGEYLKDIEIECEYAPYAGASIIVHNVYGRDEETISEDISNIIARIYERGEFWVTQ
jgi:hypothetical protein